MVNELNGNEVKSELVHEQHLLHELDCEYYIEYATLIAPQDGE